MAATPIEDALELLTKENERYRLSQIGFFRDVSREAELLVSNFPPEEGESFQAWKRRSLREYYRLRGFSAFCRRSIDRQAFESIVMRLTDNHLRHIFRSSPRTETDKYLAPDSDTVSYAMTQTIFNEIYTAGFSSMPAFGNTDELDSYCRCLAADNFPTDERRIILSLKDNDNFYWGKFYAKLRSITAAFCYQMSGIKGEEAVHDIWSDTCISVNRAVVEQKLKEPVNAKAVISYSVGVLKNKNKELARARAKTPADIDALQYRLTEEEDNKYFNNEFTSPAGFPSQIDSLSTYIDFNDKDSVRGYFIVILYNKEHPLHGELVAGYEEKVDRMFEHYIDGLSYEEIVEKHYGLKGGKEAAKECARLRQEMKRLKKSLTDRFKKITEKYR